MQLLDIRITRMDAGHVWLGKGKHYDIPARDLSSLYIPETSDIEVSVANGPFELIVRGGLVGIPKGTAHRLRLPGEPRQAVGKIEPPFNGVRRHKDSGDTVFVARHAVSANPIPDLVPAKIIIAPDEIQAEPRLKSAVSVIRDLAQLGSETADAVFVRMAEALALVLIERVVERCASGEAKVEGAFRDTRLRNAIRAMHERPANDWTLESLAREVGLSRSVFSESFRKSTGQTPYQYLTRLRIDAASQLLITPNISIAEIAWQSGYQSDAAFIKAFRRVVGISPGAYRRARVQSSHA